MGISVFDETIPWNTGTQVAAADTTTPKTIATATDRPLYVRQILATNSDAIPHVVEFLMFPNNGFAAELGAVTLPAGTGYAGAPAIDVLPLLVGAGVGLVLATTEVVNAAMLVAITGAFKVDFLVLAGLL
jgi:hypothetical protein